MTQLENINLEEAEEDIFEYTANANEPYDYLHTGLLFKLFSNFLYYVIAVPLLWVLDKLLFNFKIIGKENIQEVKSAKITISNHIHPLDCSMNAAVNYPNKVYFTTLKSNVEAPVTGKLVKLLNGIPIPREKTQKLQFFNGLKNLLNEGKTVHFYPEAELIPYSKKIRPFKNGAFKLAVLSNVPIVPLVFEFAEPYGIRRYIKKKPFIEMHVLPAMYPDVNLKRIDAIKKLKQECYEKMEETSWERIALNDIHRLLLWSYII